MKTIRFLVVTVFVLFGFSALSDLSGFVAKSYAEPREREIHQRMRELHEKIDRGVERGTLSHHDSKRLRAELNDIRDRESRMKADGRLSHHEAEKLHRELDRLSREISYEKRR